MNDDDAAKLQRSMRQALHELARVVQEQAADAPPSFNPSRTGRYHLDEFDQYAGEEFVRAAYYALLRRAPDPGGFEYYRARLNQGIAKAQILGEIRYSTEGRSVGTLVEGLTLPYAIAIAARWPVAGVLLKLAGAIWHLQDTARRQRTLEHRLARMREEMSNRAQHNSVLLYRILREMESDSQSATPHQEDADRRRYQTERDFTAIGMGATRTQSNETEQQLYASWIERFDSLSADEARRARALTDQWLGRPLISILMTCPDTAEDLMRDAIASLTAQIYPCWELCVAYDPSTPAPLRQFLDECAARDRRIRALRRNVCGDAAAALNAALNMAQGEFCLPFGAGDRLAAHALLFLAGEALGNFNTAWIYYDVDQLDATGRRTSPDFKCGPNPDLFLSINYMAAQACYRTSHLRQAGGFRPGDDGSHGLGLRMLERVGPERIRHIPHVLHHVRSQTAGHHVSTQQLAAGAGAIRDHLDRQGVRAEVEKLHDAPGYRIRFRLPDPLPLVSIIIPTRDRLDLLRPCLESLLARTDYPRREILVIDNQSADTATRDYLKSLVDRKLIRVIAYDAPFNWSAINNLAVRHAMGDILCFLNNDTETIDGSWLAEMVANAMRPQIGAVGAALWYPDGRSQHHGIVLGIGGVAWYAFHRLSRGEIPHYRCALAQNYSAVTGACVVVRRSVFDAIGGFDERNLSVSYNDIDFCLRIQRDLGLRILWTPFAELTHRESASRGLPATPEAKRRFEREMQYTINLWSAEIADDPYFSPNLALVPSPTFERADPPRVTLRQTLRRYGRLSAPKLAFVHIPRTAGSPMRERFVREYSRGAVLALPPMENLRTYERHPATLARVRRWAAASSVWTGHFSHGFADLLGLDCVYVTLLRDPVQRVLSHHRHLVTAPGSPLGDSAALKALSPADMLRKGIIPPNLMVRKLLGEKPEAVSWDELEAGGRAFAAQFCGFALPRELWCANDQQVLNLPELAPRNDPADLSRAIGVLQSEFAFVGRQEDFASLTSVLGDLLGWEKASAEPYSGSGTGAAGIGEAAVVDEIEEYNRLDRQLFDYVARLPRGMLINEQLLDRARGGLPT